MKNVKVILILLFSIQIFAAPIVKSCIGMTTMTKNTCCPPDDCSCDLNNNDIDTRIDLLKIETAHKTLIMFHHITIIDEINSVYSDLIEDNSIVQSPPLRRDFDILDFNQIYII